MPEPRPCSRALGSRRTREREACAVPLERAIGFGLGVLRLAPEQFWRMTPRELALAIEAVTGRGSAPLDRTALDDLMTRYPDDR